MRPSIEYQFPLVCPRILLLALLGLGDGGDELGATSIFNDPVGGLPALVEFPVPGWVLVGRVQDLSFEDTIGH